jgi:hypothetical protein
MIADLKPYSAMKDSGVEWLSSLSLATTRTSVHYASLATEGITIAL